MWKNVYIGWCHGSGFVDWAIQRVDNSYWNHVLLRFETAGGFSEIYESHSTGGVQITPIEHLNEARKTGKVTDYFEVKLCCNADKIWQNCLPFHGDGYAFGQILWYYTWERIRFGKGKPRGKRKNIKRLTCNMLVTEALTGEVKQIPVFDLSLTPERLFRLFSFRGIGSKEMFR